MYDTVGVECVLQVSMASQVEDYADTHASDSGHDTGRQTYI